MTSGNIVYTDSIINSILEDADKIHMSYLHSNQSDKIDKITLDTLSKEYPFLHHHYPSIIKISYSNSYNRDRLKHMLSIRADMDKGKISKDKADVKVGQMLFDKLIKPVLPPEKTKE